MKITQFLFATALSVTVAACSGGSSSSDDDSGGDAGGDSGSEQNIEGLTMPQSMSVVTASGEVEGMRLSAMKKALKLIPSQLNAMSYNGAETDYTTDEVNTYVWDESMESLDIINEIICYIDQTGYKEMVNQDPYIALINSEKCNKGGSESSQNDQSSGSNATSFESWTVHSTRVANEPQVVNIWFPDVDPYNGETDGYMRVQTIITEGVSEELPFGNFTLNFEFYDDDDNVTGGGVLKTADAPEGSSDDAVAFLFYESGAETESFGMDQEITFVRTTQIMVVFDDADGDSGVAVVKRFNIVPGEDNPELTDGELAVIEGELQEEMDKTFDVAFNDTHFYSAVYVDREADTLNIEEESCRNRSEFDTQVWRYNLYYGGDGDNAGSRVDINSGFPFTAQLSEDEKVFGHIGYWGVWVEPGTDISSITTITRDNFGRDSEQQDAETYTLVQSPGKMLKSTKTEVDVNDIAGLQLGWYPWIPPECGEQITCEGVEELAQLEGNEYIVEYETDDGFYVIGTRMWGENGEDTDYLDTPFKVDMPWMNFWSQQLGGSVSYPFVNSQGEEDDTKATIFVETFVNGADEAFGEADSLTLHCFQECLKAEISQDEINQSVPQGEESPASPFYESAPQEWDEFGNPEAPSVAAATYTFDKATLTLTVASVAGSTEHEDVGKVVRLGTSGSPVTPDDSSQYTWGIQSQAMLTSIEGLESVWDTWNADVSYRWETGANSWNIYSAVKDANGDYVQFDAPLQILYKHDDANDINWEVGDDNTENHDKTFKLEYGGNGDLWGIPGDHNCDDNGNEGGEGIGGEGEGGEEGDNECHGRWSNAFSLKDGTPLTVETSTGTIEYVVKGIEIEQSMTEEDDAATCTAGDDALATDVNLVLPTADDIDGITEDMASYGEKPVVEDAPAVIEGEIQIVIE